MMPQRRGAGRTWGRRAAALVALSVIAASGTHEAAAEIGAVHPDLVRAEAAVRAAKGPEIYAALREVWRMWDRADPAQVEEAIAEVAESSSTPAPARVYASLLDALARRRRGDLDGATARIARLGFVGRWMTLGPFDNENKGGFTRAFAPELEPGMPIDMSRTYDGKERPVRWRVPPSSAAYGWIDLGEVMRPREDVCAYATTFVAAKAGTSAPRRVSLWVGAAGAFRVQWNGETVLEDTGYREFDADRFAAGVTLLPGNNRITVKVCGTDESPKLAVRIGDEQGAPDLGVEVAPDLVAAANAPHPNLPGRAKAAPKPTADAAKAAPKPIPHSGPEGPMQTFERMVGGPHPPPA